MDIVAIYNALVKLYYEGTSYIELEDLHKLISDATFTKKVKADLELKLFQLGTRILYYQTANKKNIMGHMIGIDIMEHNEHDRAIIITETNYMKMKRRGNEQV